MRVLSWAVFALSTAGLACGESTSPEDASPLRLSLTAPSRVLIGDSAAVVIVLRNESDSEFPAVYPGSGGIPHGRLVVLRQSGDTVWSHAGSVTLPNTSNLFSPNGSVQQTLVWPLQDRAGAAVVSGPYRLYAELDLFEADRERTLRSAEITVVVADR